MSENPRLPRLMTAKEVAAQTGLPLSRVYELTRSGDLPSIRFGRACRYNPADLSKVFGEQGSPTQAARRQRAPKRRSPRVVRDNDGYRYRIVDGRLQAEEADNGDWYETQIDLKVVADLLANPFEEIDE